MNILHYLFDKEEYKMSFIRTTINLAFYIDNRNNLEKYHEKIVLFFLILIF